MKKSFYFTLGYMKHKSQLYGLSKKIKKAGKDFFEFSVTVKLTRKIDSRISNINICPDLKMPMPIMYR